MAFITIILLFILLTINVYIYRHLLSPAVLTNSVWLILLIIYNIVDHGLYQLSDHFYNIVILWNLGFTISSYVSNKIKLCIPRPMMSLNKERLGNILLPVMTISLVLSIIGLYIIGENFNTENVFAGIRMHSVSVLNGETETIILPIYIRVGQIIASYAIVVIGTYYFLYGKKSFTVICAMFLLILFTLFRSNKTVVVQLVFCILTLYVINNKPSKKVILSFIIIFIVLMLAAHLMRSKNDVSDFNLGHMIAVYLLSPLPAFDYISTAHINLIEDFHGEYTFRAFIPYINYMGYNLIGNSDPFNLHLWTNTPLPTNVYTVFFSFYTDFGIPGIIMASLFYGSFFSVLWKGCVRRIPMFQIAYASCVYVLAFQFFTDYLFTFFWANTLTMLFAVLFFTHFTLGHKSIKRLI